MHSSEPESLLDTIVPGVGKRLGDCTKEDIEVARRHCAAAAKRAAQREKRLRMYLAGKIHIPPAELDAMIAEAKADTGTGTGQLLKFPAAPGKFTR